MMAIDLRMLTAEEVAEILGVSVRTLTDWRYEGRGPAYYRYGGKGPGSYQVRYALHDVKAWLEQWRVSVPEQQAAPEIPPIRRYRKRKLNVEG